MTLKIQHIAKSFGEKEVLKDVSFTLQKARVSVLMGTNGSGKTTLFNILSGFLKPDKGQITLDNHSLGKVSPHKLNRLGITRTFQNLRLIENLTVLENVLLAFSAQKGEQWWSVLLPNRSVKKEQENNKDKAIKILKTCFIDNVVKSKAGEISYGQQKLLTIACCIANGADYMLLDEPVAGVNPTYREKLIQIIQNLKEKNKALLIIEHNTDFIENIADEIFFLNEGTIKQYPDYASMRQDEYVKEAYI